MKTWQHPGRRAPESGARVMTPKRQGLQRVERKRQSDMEARRAECQGLAAETYRRLPCPGRGQGQRGLHRSRAPMERMNRFLPTSVNTSRTSEVRGTTTKTFEPSHSRPINRPAAMHDTFLPFMQHSAAHTILAGTRCAPWRARKPPNPDHLSGRVVSLRLGIRLPHPCSTRSKGLLIDEGVSFADLKGHSSSFLRPNFSEADLGSAPSALRSSRLLDRPARWISAAPWSRTGKRRLMGWKVALWAWRMVARRTCCACLASTLRNTRLCFGNGRRASDDAALRRGRSAHFSSTNDLRFHLSSFAERRTRNF